MYNMNSMRLGGGGRFKKLSAEVGSPALAAFIGRKKHGNKKFQNLSAVGRMRAATKRHMGH